MLVSAGVVAEQDDGRLALTPIGSYLQTGTPGSLRAVALQFTGPLHQQAWSGLLPSALQGDHDPLDICVISERPITKSDIILPARVVGGLPMLDGGEADDKIIAVLANDNLWAHVEELAELPSALVQRLRHYFSTYKLIPGEASQVSIDAVYDRRQAERVIEAAMADYQEMVGE